MKPKNIFLLSLLGLALLGLVMAAWQSNSDSSAGDWQPPVIQVNQSTPTMTATPGWWQTPVERPVIPTMPGKNTHLTPTSERPHP